MFPEQLGMVLLDFAENELLADYWRKVRESTKSVGEQHCFMESLNTEWHKILEIAKAYDVEKKAKAEEPFKTVWK